MNDSRPQSVIELMNSEEQIRSSKHQHARPIAGSEAHSEESTQLGRCRIARRPQMMLAIRLCSGEVEVLPYATLSRISSGDTDSKLRLSFCLAEIQIEGSGLTSLYHYLCEHRVMEICQNDRTDSMTAEKDICVDRITLKFRDAGH